MIKYSHDYRMYSKQRTFVYIANKDVQYPYQLFPPIAR